MENAFNELVRNLLGNRSEQRDDSLLNWVGADLKQFLKSEVGDVTVKLCSLLLNLVHNFLSIFLTVCEHSIPGEVIVSHAQQRKVVPGVHARHDYI